MTYDDPPPLLPPDLVPAVRTDADLLAAWRSLVGELGFAGRSLWVLFLTPHGRPAGPLLTIDDLPDGPHGLGADDLATLCREILEGPGEGGSVALLVTRQGRDPWHVGDRAWARYLTETAGQIGGRVWPVHRANDAELVAVPDRRNGREPLTPS
jgi:hypothetical protein